jgi:ribosome-associated translation inhibitor RaiA
MKEDAYQNAIDYFANEIVRRLKRGKNKTREDQESQLTDDMDAFCEDIAGEVSKKMGWD